MIEIPVDACINNIYLVSLIRDLSSSKGGKVIIFFTPLPSPKHTQFQHHVSVHYQYLCSLLTLELKYEVRSLLRRIFVRIGHEFDIIQRVETLPGEAAIEEIR